MRQSLDDSLTYEDLRLSFSAESEQLRPLTRSQLKRIQLEDSTDIDDSLTSLTFTSNSLKREQEQWTQHIDGRKLKREENTFNDEDSNGDSDEDSNQDSNQDSNEDKHQLGPTEGRKESSQAGQETEQSERELTQKQELIRGRMRQLDLRIRDLQMERNRLKYFLRREKDVQNIPDAESLETKECPCCGKLISKLCFRCEHLYCKVENCPRKKKQRLNARMLEKMRGKVKGTRQKRLKQVQGIKERPGESGSDSEEEDYWSQSEEEQLGGAEVKVEVKVEERPVMELPSLTFSSEFRDSQIFFEQ